MGEQSKWVIRVVSTMWVLNLLAGMVPYLDYEPSEAVNGIFMAIVGSIYLAGRTGERDDDDSDKKKVLK